MAYIDRLPHIAGPFIGTHTCELRPDGIYEHGKQAKRGGIMQYEVFRYVGAMELRESVGGEDPLPAAVREAQLSPGEYYLYPIADGVHSFANGMIMEVHADGPGVDLRVTRTKIT